MPPEETHQSNGYIKGRVGRERKCQEDRLDKVYACRAPTIALPIKKAEITRLPAWIRLSSLQSKALSSSSRIASSPSPYLELRIHRRDTYGEQEHDIKGDMVEGQIEESATQSSWNRASSGLPSPLVMVRGD